MRLFYIGPIVRLQSPTSAPCKEDVTVESTWIKIYSPDAQKSTQVR